MSSIWTDIEIISNIRRDQFEIEPFFPASIQPASIDLHAGLYGKVVRNDVQELDPRNPPEEDSWADIRLGNRYSLLPGHTILIATREKVKLNSNTCGFIASCSSLGRLGLMTHSLPWIDPGYEGVLTIALSNTNIVPIVLYDNMRVCQLVLATGAGEAYKPYVGRYIGSKDVTVPKRPSSKPKDTHWIHVALRNKEADGFVTHFNSREEHEAYIRE